MEINDFIENLNSYVFDDFEGLELKEETDFKQLEEWDSMGLMLLIGMYDQKYNKSVSGEQINSCVTIKDLFELI